MERLCRVAYLLAPLPALLAIPVAASMSPWWRLWFNAISDLGNPFKSGPIAAAVIDSAYVLTGIILGIVSYCYKAFSRAERILLFLVGYTLSIVGVVNESYGPLHFAVSVAFFLTLAACIVAFAVYSITRLRRLLPAILYLAGVAACIVMWYYHFTAGLPPGAAIPELVSVALFLSYYYPRSMISTGTVRGTG